MNSISEEQLDLLKEKIKSSFLNRSLFKGAAQVIKAIEERVPISKVYLVGPLDKHYEKAILACIKDCETKLQLYWLDKIHTRLVYDVIKDLNTRGNKSRRFFLCRAFAI